MSMMDLIQRFEDYSIAIIYLSKKIPKTPEGFHFQSQLVRSSTSVAANFRAARLGQSEAAFIAKLSIAIEEADETFYWLRMIRALGLCQNEDIDPLIREAHEIASIMIRMRKNARNRLAKQNTHNKP